MTLKSEICVPDDHTQATCTPMVVEYDFKLVVESCIVSDYTATQKVPGINYNVGASSLIKIGQYVFDEDANCNYPETVTVTNLPDFITHNEDSSDFTLPQTSDLSLIGTYTVTIRSEIQVPEDHTGSSFKTLFAEYDFVITVEPCLITSYSAT